MAIRIEGEFTTLEADGAVAATLGSVGTRRPTATVRRSSPRSVTQRPWVDDVFGDENGRRRRGGQVQAPGRHLSSRLVGQQRPQLGGRPLTEEPVSGGT
jgi:hypothetical protein